MDSCEEASELAHNVTINVILVTLIIISTIAIVVEIWIMHKTTNRMLIHQNTRILIIVHQLWLIFHCIARIFANTYILVMYWRTQVNKCGYMISPWECFMIRSPIVLTSTLNAASIPTIVIERAIATYFSSRYEKFGKSIAIILIIAQVAIGIGTFIYSTNTSGLLSSVKMFSYCSAANDENVSKVVVVLGFYRFHRNEIHANLSRRYQIIENISSVQTLSPMVIFHSLFLSSYLGALFIYFLFDFNFSHKQFVIYLESVQQTPIYALTLPFAIFWTEKYVRKIKQANRQKAMEFMGTEAANHYFAIFEAPAGKNV